MTTFNSAVLLGMIQGYGLGHVLDKAIEDSERAGLEAKAQAVQALIAGIQSAVANYSSTAANAAKVAEQKLNDLDDVLKAGCYALDTNEYVPFFALLGQKSAAAALAAKVGVAYNPDAKMPEGYQPSEKAQMAILGRVILPAATPQA